MALRIEQIRRSSWMSAWMNSSSASPDFARMSRFSVAMEASLRPISSVTMAGSVSIEAASRQTMAPGDPRQGAAG